MALTRDTTAEHIKPLEGARIQRFTCGSTISAGQPVALASDGQIDPAQGTSVALAMVVGVALTGGAVNDTIDVVTDGRVLCGSSGTVGALVYISDTAGTYGETAGTKTTIIGYNYSATVLFVRIQIVSLS